MPARGQSRPRGCAPDRALHPRPRAPRPWKPPAAQTDPAVKTSLPCSMPDRWRDKAPISGRWATLMPQPMTTALRPSCSCSASIRIPEVLCPLISRSLGHLILSPSRACFARHKRQASTSNGHGATAAGWRAPAPGGPDRSAAARNRDCPGSDTRSRPPRPRPPVWRAAVIHRPPGITRPGPSMHQRWWTPHVPQPLSMAWLEIRTRRCACPRHLRRRSSRQRRPQAERSADQDIEQDEQAGNAKDQAQFTRHRELTEPLGSSNHMILMIRR